MSCFLTQLRLRMFGAMLAWPLFVAQACTSSSSSAVTDGDGGKSLADGGAAEGGTADGDSLCDTQRQATAYKATADMSVALDALPAEAGNPVPCLAYTGQGANEPGVGITRDGTVYFAPATTKEGTGVLKSEDLGATWTLSVPKRPDGNGLSRLQPFLYVDPKTDRIFFASSKLVLDGLATFKDEPGIDMVVSDDGGDTWSYHSMAPKSRDWHKIFAGPPATSDTGDYPHVTYFSSPSPIAGNWAGFYPPPDFQHFYKSLDGGKTWKEVSQIPIDPKKVEGCTPDDFIMFSQGTVGPDGTVYLGYRLCQQLAVNVSHDEGATWVTHEIPGAQLPPYPTGSLAGILSIVGGENAITGQPIATDQKGNLYAVWADPKFDLYFASSRDGGKTWTEPVWVMAPGVKTARMVTITARKPGEVAFSYFGSKDGTKFDGYIAESHNALEAEPTFWTVTVNDPKEPLYPDTWESGYDTTYFNNGGDEITLLQIQYAPNGDIWASFVKDMCPKHNVAGCSWDYQAHAHSRFQGAAGRMKHAKAN